MNRLQIIGMGITLVLSGGLLSVGAAEQSQRAGAENGHARWTQETERLMDDSKRLGNLTGNRVRNNEDERLGSLNDLVIKLPSGEIKYAVVSSGGIFGFGAKGRLVPYDMLSMSDDGSVFRLNVNKELWENVPEFDKDKMDELDSNGLGDRIKEILGFSNDADTRHQDRDARSNRDEDEKDEDRYDNAQSERAERGQQQQRAGQRSQSGERSEHGADESTHYLVSDLLDYDVVDAQDESVGRISDFLIGQDNKKVSHVLLSIGGFMRVGDEKFAVSPNELQFDKEEKKVRLPVAKEAFSDSRTAEQENWFQEIFN